MIVELTKLARHFVLEKVMPRIHNASLSLLQVFEKALDEPKYSSMYAQLCKRLAETAPNFDPPEKPCTFRRLLLNKCRDEFENRAQLYSQVDYLYR